MKRFGDKGIDTLTSKHSSFTLLYTFCESSHVPDVIRQSQSTLMVIVGNIQSYR